MSSLESKFLAYIQAARNALTIADAKRAVGDNLSADDDVAYARTMIKRSQLIADSCPSIREKYKLANPNT